MAQRFGEGFIANFTALMLVKSVAHNKFLLKRSQRNTAEVAPCSHDTVEIDVDNHIT